jgi:hypothetical protein
MLHTTHKEALIPEQHPTIRPFIEQDTMDTIDHFDALQPQIILGMFCSAVLSILQPDMKYSSVQFYENLYMAMMLWNIMGTGYLGLRLLGLIRGRGEAWWYIPMKIIETMLWVLPVFFVGFEGGLLAKRHIIGERMSLTIADNQRLTY